MIAEYTRYPPRRPPVPADMSGLLLGPSVLHGRILDAVRPLCRIRGLVLAGGYALRAHGLPDRPDDDLTLVTVDPAPLAEITTELAAMLAGAGLESEVGPGSVRMARLTVTDPAVGQAAALDVRKEPLQCPPVPAGPHQVVGLDDLIGMTVGALCGRAAPYDFVVVTAMADRVRGYGELERLGGVFEDGFSAEELAFALEAGLALDDAAFARYGLTEPEIAEVKAFVLGWYEDLLLRIAEETEVDPDL